MDKLEQLSNTCYLLTMTNSDTTNVAVISVSEFRRLISVIDDDLIGSRDRAMIILLFSAYMQADRIRKIKIRDLTLGKGVATIAMGSPHPVEIVCNKNLANALTRYHNMMTVRPKMDVPFFQSVTVHGLSVTGKPVSARQIHRRIADYGVKAGLNKIIGANSIRVSGLLHHINSGGDFIHACRVGQYNILALARQYQILSDRNLIDNEFKIR